MASYEGVLPTPNAVVAAKKRIQSLNFTAIAVCAVGVLSCAVLYFALGQIETLDERAILPIIALEALTMIGLTFYFRKQSRIFQNVVDKVAGKEVVFYPAHVELAATVFQYPNPKPALQSDYPYLKIQYRDIQSVRMLAKPKDSAIEILMMNDNRISMNRSAFVDAEQNFFLALHSHKVSVPTLG